MSPPSVKFYIHLEGTEPEYTLAVHWPESAPHCVEELCVRFAAAFTKAHPDAPALAAGEVRLADEDGAEIPPTARIMHVVHNGCDLFAKRGPMRVVAPPAPQPAAAAAGGASSTAASGGGTSGGSAGGASSAAALSEMNKAMAPYIKAADEQWKVRQYKKAGAIYSELLSTIGTIGSFTGAAPAAVVIATRRLGEIELINERAEAALGFLVKAQRMAPSDIETKLLLSRAHEMEGETDEAVSEMRAAVALVPGSRPKRKKTLTLKLGSLLFRVGERKEGGGMVQHILQGDMEDPEALHAYGECAVELGQTEDALKIFLRMIVQKSEDKPTRKLLSRTLQQPGGLDYLQSHLPPSKGTASAHAFLASVVKDNSAIDESIALYEGCVKHSPDNASYCLNLMHLHEIQGRYANAIAVLHTYCEANPTRTVGTLSLAELAAALPEPRAIIARNVNKMVNKDPPPAEGSQTYTVPEMAGQDAEKGVGASRMKPAGTYGSDELDILALMFTATKICYVCGMLEALPRLITLIEPTRTVRDLHLTLVRNENAYYCCVAQLASSLPLPLPAYPHIYVLGDSHILAPAWRTVEYYGEPHILRPKLATGCKIWHLRDASDFFPKANFQAAIQSIPDGSPVITAFGEIDCREGLLVAVERARYADLQAGIDHTVSIYITVLKKLVSSKRLKIMVHPVPPVLDETRSIVKRFNTALKAAVEAEQRLTWLDFFPKMLSPDGEKLADGLALDGTHLHPSYVAHVDDAIKAAGLNCYE